METDNDRNMSNRSAEIKFRTGERPPPPLPIVSPSRAEDETQMLSYEAQRKELEIQNAELLQARKETERILQKNKNLFDLAPVGGVILGRDGIIRNVNLVGAEILGGGPSDLIGLQLEQFIPDAARSVYTEFLRKVLGGGQKANFEMELTIGGNRSIIRFVGVSDISRDECHIAMIDIIDRRVPEVWADTSVGDPKLSVKELSGELTRANRERSQEKFRHKQQRKLASHLMAIREEERTTVAREIHDELGQMLASLQLNVSLITLEYRDHEQLVARAKAMEEMINSSIMTVQRISSELRPVMLDQLGLADAMEWQAQEFKKRAGISCKTIILLKEKNVDHDLSTAIYRIFQEALTNIIRHSGATSVHVDLLERKGWLTLSVRDDGRGITEKEKKALLSLGIAGMRERAEALGGKLRIFGSPQHGTVLFAQLPLSREGGSACPPGY